MFALKQRHRFGSAIDRDYFISGVFQRAGQIGAHGFFVFGQQDADHRHFRFIQS